MTTDPQHIAPTDAELMDLGHECEFDAIAFGRAVLTNWGTPQPVVGVEPAQWQKRHQLRTNGEWENTKAHDAKWWSDNSQGWEIRALYTTPQPTQAQAEPKSGAKSFQTYGEANAYSKGYYAGKKAATQAQAQAGAVPLTDEQIEAAAPEYSVDDFLDFNAGVRFAERHHGIKGGQHGTE